ncbi:MAG: ROK family protein [Nocardioidaceae bacterium]
MPTNSAAPSADSSPGADAPVPFGVDFGGSGIKGAPVDLATGEFAADRTRIETPKGGRPQDVAEVIGELVRDGAADGAPVGITIPGVVVHGVVKSAANIDSAWIYTDAATMFRERLRREVVVVNDADAAGLAEVRYGAAKDQQGLVIVTTLGTGIGTALVHDGVLVPNAELGHLELNGKDAEKQAANSVRESKDLSWQDWAEVLTDYYRMLEALFSPELFVVGGGVSKHAHRFLPLLELNTPIVPATLRNTAGIVGAAVLAAEAQGVTLDPPAADRS